MKAMKWVGLMTALVLPLLAARAQTPSDAPPPAAGSPPAVSPMAAEVVKMAGAGTSDDVLLAYIKNATATFDLSADQILYLRDIGITSPVITAMLGRDTELKNQPAMATAPPPGPAQAPEPAPMPGPAPAPVQAPPPVYVSSPPPDVGYFYDNLSPYGTWVQLDGVGWCWQPRAVVVNHGWRPYCDSGHWVFTDAGWFWQSDYSWGWAPFHYGRWYMHERCGWVWTPDRVWGPAWVTWRSEGEHCGWAPLPPHAEFDFHSGYRFNGVHVALNFDFGLRPDHFTFIALRDFSDHDFAHHRLPPTQVTQIYNNTTIINNYVVKNNTVVNQGIKVDRVTEATHTQFKKVAIRDTPAWSPSQSNSRGPAKAESAVYRPQLKAPARPVNIVAQKVDDRHPVIEHPAVVPAKSQRPLVASSPTPASGNRAPQGQNQGNWPRPAIDRAPAYSQPQPTPKLDRPGNSSAPSTPSATRPEPARSGTPPSTAPQARPNQERSSSTYPSSNTPNQPASTRPSYPVRSGSSPSETYARPNPQTQNSPPYYPKGYYQAGETRALPPANSARPSDSRPSDSRGQPSTSNRPGGSKRNDQQ